MTAGREHLNRVDPSATAYLAAQADRPRNACQAIAGYCYQALATILLALDLSPTDSILIEGLEDIDVLHGSGDAPQQTGPNPRTHYQIKYTGQPRMNWGDQAVHGAILEFLILFAQRAAGSRPRLVFFTPATLGGSSGRAATALVSRWRRFTTDGDPAFLPYVRTILQARIRAAHAELEFATRSQQALDSLDDARLSEFARAVVWSDGHPGMAEIHAALAERLEREFVPFGLSGTTAVDVLLSHILFLAATHPMDPTRRIIRHGAIGEWLTHAAPRAGAWSTARLFDQLSNMEQRIDAMQAEVSEIPQLRSNVNAIERRVEDIADQVTAIVTSQATTATAASGSLSVPFGGLGGSDIEERCRPIVERLGAGRLFQAVAMIELEAARADLTVGERAYLYYLKACALSGSDRYQAQTWAERAAATATDADWRTTLRVLAQVYAGSPPASDDLEQLEHLARISSADGKALAAAIILAELDLEGDRPSDALRRITGHGQDVRAIKIAIRAHNDLGQADMARQMMAFRFGSGDPERWRFESHLAIKQFFTEFARPHRRLPTSYHERAAAVVLSLDHALARCPDETKYRRAEIIGNRAHFLIWSGRADEAILALEDAIRKRLDGPEIHFALAMALARMGQSSRAIEHASACVVGCAPNASRLRLNAMLLQAEISLHDRATIALAPGGCAAVERDAAASVDQRNRARALAVRALLSSGNQQQARVCLDSWPTAEREQYYAVSAGAVAEREGRYDDAITTCHAICEDAVDNLVLRREALLITALALWRKGAHVDAAARGDEAMRIGISVDGCAIPLACYWAAHDMAGAASLEAYVLAIDPDNIEALRSAVRRLQDAHDTTAIIPLAKRLASVATDIQDAYLACATLWNRGLRIEAALAFARVRPGSVTTEHCILASETCAMEKDWPGAMRFALQACATDPGSRQAATIAVHRSLQLEIHGGDRSEFRAAIARVWQAAAQDFSPPILQAIPGDVETILAMVRERHHQAEAACAQYERHQMSTAVLAARLGSWHPGVIYRSFASPGIHFHNGPVPFIRPGSAQVARLSSKRLLLDLPSWCMAHAADLIHGLRHVGVLIAALEHIQLIQSYLSSLDDVLARAEHGDGGHLTIHGLQRPDPAQIQAETRFFTGLLASIRRFATIESLPVPDGIENRIPDQTGIHQHIAVAIQGGMSYGAVLPVLLDAQSLRDAPGPAIGFHVLLLASRDLGVLTEAEYNRSITQCLRYGLRRLGVSFSTLTQAHAADGNTIGPNVRCIMAQMREGKWNRDQLCRNTTAFLLSLAAGQTPAIPRRDAIRCVVSLLHGRSFDRKTRRQALVGMSRLLAIPRHLLPDGITTTMVEQATDLLQQVRIEVQRGDPMAMDEHMPGRRRLIGQKYLLQPGSIPLTTGS